MMKVKNSVIVVLALLGLQGSVRAENISLTVVGEDGQPVDGADVVIEYVGALPKYSKANYGKTDRDGRYSAGGKILFQGVYARVTKDGYYKWVKESGFARGQDHSVTAVLRKIENPIPLYVRRVNLEFQVFDKWLAFDFEAGDWVAPQGRGKTRDILFKFQREFKGYRFSKEKLEKMKFPDTTEEDLKKFYGKWDGVLWVDFPSDLGGVVEERNGYLPYSEMKMPHMAPGEGYKGGEIEIKKKSYKSKEEEAEEMRNYIKFGEGEPSGYFIRTRVVEAEGKVVKANYAKLPSEISVGAGGFGNFTYYFNPTPNERNLEYRPQSNLASEQEREYEP